jgi:restriction endonuclease S subunit
VLTSDTKRRIDSCRDILVGKLPLPTDQVELITLALIYKFMDDLDEESVAMGGKRSFFTGPLAAYRWRALTAQTVSADERMTRFADGLELLGGGKKLRVPKKHGKKGEEEEIDPAAHLPALFRDIFRNAFLKFRDGRILTLFLTELGGFAYSHSEELGNAFEYILQCMGAQGDNGQFRTPRHIIDFMVACLDPSPTDKILDPACGTGGFLVSAFKHILQKNTSPGSTLPGDRLGHEQRQRLYANLTGYDTNDQMVKLSRVNLFLHQFASPTIHIYDTLTNDARWAEKADLILANPPFMTPKGGVVPHTRFRIPAKKSEVLFTDYIAEHLTPDGRAGVIVPNGIVATTQNAYVKLRRFLVEDSLVAVVSLPAGCFKPYSGVKTSILFLDKKLARQTDKILFLKISADGFDLGDQRREIAANDLPEAERILGDWFGRAKGPASSERAKGPTQSTNGAASSQPGATPQETNPAPTRGLKARSISVAASDESGLQPSAKSSNQKPGALPQAGMGGTVGAAKSNAEGSCAGGAGQGQRPVSFQPGSPARDPVAAVTRADSPVNSVAWKLVEKRELLEHSAVSLQAEVYFGEQAAPSTGEVVSLGDVATFCSGGTPSKANAGFWQGDIPWVSPKDMKSLVLTDTEDHVSAQAVESSATKLLPVGTVLCVVRSGILQHTLPVAITARPMCTNQDILAITPDTKRLDPKYLLFVLKGRSTEILRDGIKTGVTVQSFHNGFFKTYEIPLPPLEEQRRIVAEIEGFQQVIDGARQILAAYHPSFDIDAGWPMVELSSIICEKPKNGYSGQPVQHPTKLKVLSLSATTSGRLDATKFKYLDEEIPQNAQCRCRRGDIYLQRGNTAELVGTAALFDIDDPNFIYPDLMIRVRADESKILTKFLLHTLQSEPVRAFLTSQAGGAAGSMPKINQGIVERVPIPLPPLPEQERIVAELDGEAARLEAVRGLIPAFEAKIQRVLARVWGAATTKP